MIRSILNSSSEAELALDYDLVESLNEYFEDFEYKVYTNRFEQIDKRVVYLIIRKFKRLFELWDENVIFSKFLEGDSFREIFIMMYNVFGNNFNKTSNTGCYLECELCGEEIVLRNNDPEYSFRLHEMSKYHLEFLRNLKSIRGGDDEDPIFEQISSDRGEFLECHLCRVSVPIHGDNVEITDIDLVNVIDSHQQEETHRSNFELYTSNKSHIKVYDAEDKMYACESCEQIYHIDLLVDHLKSSSHQENLTKVRVPAPAPPKKSVERDDEKKIEDQKADFEVFKTNMQLISVIDDAIRCVLCETDLTSVDMVVKHLVGEKHTENLEKYMRKDDDDEKKKPIDETIDEDEEEFLDTSNADDGELREPVQNEKIVDESANNENMTVTRSKLWFWDSNYVVSVCCLFIALFAILIVFWRR